MDGRTEGGEEGRESLGNGEKRKLAEASFCILLFRAKIQKPNGGILLQAGAWHSHTSTASQEAVAAT